MRRGADLLPPSEHMPGGRRFSIPTTAYNLTAMARGFRTDIQGMRALAVGLVVLYHAGVSALSGGYVGVDVFFVISGFLITSHLLSQLQANGKVRLRDFYARRVRRILPASLATLVLTAVATLLFVPPLLWPGMMRDVAATALYIPNVWFAYQGTDYLAETSPSVVQQYWSLGVEEQFYVVWPLLLIGLYRLTKGRITPLGGIVCALIVASFAAGFVATVVSQPLAFFSLPTRAWQLGLGGLLAIALLRAPQLGASRAAGLGAWLGLVAIGASALMLDSSTAYPGAAALVPTVGAALVILGANAAPWSPHRLLSIGPAQWLGKISYSVYLVHWPILIIPTIASVDGLPLGLTLVLGAASLPAGWASWKFIEERFRKPRSPAAARRVLLPALAAPALAAALAVAVSVLTPTLPLHADVTADPFEPHPHPVAAAVVPANLAPSLWGATDDLAEIYSDGCHKGLQSTDPEPCTYTATGDATDVPHVALVGDSHAAQWYPALRPLVDAGDIDLSVYTRSSCGAVERFSDTQACHTWRDAVLDHLEANPPDIVLMATYSNAFERDADRWARATQDFVDATPAISEVAIMADTPFMGETPGICLSARLDSADGCERNRSDAINADIAGAEEAATGATRIDLNDYACNDQTCPAVVDDLLLYRDSNHLTARFVEYLSPMLREQLLT